MYTVEQFYTEHGALLDLELIAGKMGLKRKITVPEVDRPGLSLASFMRGHAAKRILIFGRVEIEYLSDLTSELRVERLFPLLSPKTPAIIVARKYRPPKELITLCEHHQLPLFRVPMTTMNLFKKLTVILSEAFAPCMSCHGSLVEVFGMGVLIKGDSGVGKSETALGLIERGHRLVSDDVVKIKKREGNLLEGSGAELTRHHMEIRGIGIINIANLYGIVCVREKINLDIVVKLEVWDDHQFYDRIGLDDKITDLLGVALPYYVLPVKPGRDVVLLLETIALNCRLKQMGYHSAKDFSNQLLNTIARKSYGRK